MDASWRTQDNPLDIIQVRPDLIRTEIERVDQQPFAFLAAPL
jgi:hypothetical protein